MRSHSVETFLLGNGRRIRAPGDSSGKTSARAQFRNIVTIHRNDVPALHLVVHGKLRPWAARRVPQLSIHGAPRKAYMEPREHCQWLAWYMFSVSCKLMHTGGHKCCTVHIYCQKKGAHAILHCVPL